MNSKKVFYVMRLLNKRRKIGLLSVRHWHSMYEIYQVVGSGGHIKKICKYLQENKIIDKDEKGYFYNFKNAQIFLKSLEEAKCFREHDLGDIFG